MAFISSQIIECKIFAGNLWFSQDIEVSTADLKNMKKAKINLMWMNGEKRNWDQEWKRETLSIYRQKTRIEDEKIYTSSFASVIMFRSNKHLEAKL